MSLIVPPSKRSTLLVLLALAVGLTACPRAPLQRDGPAVIWELTDAAVVESVEEIAGGGLRVAREGAEDIEVRPNFVPLRSQVILPAHLLLLASHGSAVAYATIRDGDAGCYPLNEPATDDGTHILFDFGLRLPKAPEFDPGIVRDGQFSGFQQGFCLNSRGEVVSYE